MTTPRKVAVGRWLASGLLFFAGPALWLAVQQGGGAATYLECAKAGAPWGVGAALVALGAAVLVILQCWTRRHRGSQAQRFLMIVAAGAGAIFAAAILVMIVAMLVIPPCAR